MTLITINRNKMKNYKKIYFLLIALLLLATGVMYYYNNSLNQLTNPKPIKITYAYGCKEANSIIQSLSLINLIATPEKYNGQMVSVIGFVKLQYEGNALYLSKDDYGFVRKNALWLSLDLKKLEIDEKTLEDEFTGKQVQVIGIFNMNNKGHFGLYSGAIDNVSCIMTWE